MKKYFAVVFVVVFTMATIFSGFATISYADNINSEEAILSMDDHASMAQGGEQEQECDSQEHECDHQEMERNEAEIKEPELRTSAEDDIEHIRITDFFDRCEYTGSEIIQPMLVWYDDECLQRNFHYKTTYLNNIEPGVATVIIEGLGSYNFRIEKTFEIYEKVIEEVPIPTGKTFTYTGKAFTFLKETDQYTIYGINSAKKVGYYNVILNLNDKDHRVWSDGTTTEKTVTWRINAPKTKAVPKVTLSATSYTWNGKTKQPTVTAKDGSKKLPATQYTISYSGNRKSVGTHKVIVKFKDNYAGTGTATFTINPKGTTIKELTAGRNAFTVRWNKQATKMPGRITGYQIQLSKGSKFTSNRTVTIKGYSKTSTRISGLQKGKKYYVRIRTYTNTGGKNYYSNWSKAKTVTVKSGTTHKHSYKKGKVNQKTGYRVDKCSCGSAKRVKGVWVLTDYAEPKRQYMKEIWKLREMFRLYNVDGSILYEGPSKEEMDSIAAVSWISPESSPTNYIKYYEDYLAGAELVTIPAKPAKGHWRFY